MRELWAAREKASEEGRAGGVKVTTVDKEPFIDAMKPVYDKYRERPEDEGAGRAHPGHQ